MVIRILLRRQDYDQLLGMIEADFVSDRNELTYCLRSLDKIREHNDLAVEKEEQYWRLHQFLKARGL